MLAIVKRVGAFEEMWLRKDGVRIGMFITVVATKDNKTTCYHGKVFKLLAINLPFIAVKWMELEDCVKGFDVREYDFIELSPEYVKAMEINNG